MAQELDISATPARESLLAPQSEGFLKVEPRRGFLVSPPSAQDVRDTFAAQALLAGRLTSQAAAVATPADVRTLETLQAGLDAAVERGYYDRVEQLNFELHRTIYRLARASKISWLLGATLRYVPRDFFAAVPGWPEASAHDHHAVLTALRNRDGEAARAAMSPHVSGAGTLLAASRPALRNRPVRQRTRTAFSSTIELFPTKVVKPPLWSPLHRHDTLSPKSLAIFGTTLAP